MNRVSTAASERVAACSSEPAAAEPLPALAEIEAMRCLELAEHDAKRLEHDAMLDEATSEVQGASFCNPHSRRASVCDAPSEVATPEPQPVANPRFAIDERRCDLHELSNAIGGAKELKRVTTSG